ncbi:MAG: DUF167 family protein [Xanthobacteraceae bacterium]
MSAVQDLPWHLVPGGVLVDVRLTPRGGRDAIEGIARRADGRVVLKARVRAAPSEGEANAALCRLLAGAVGVALRQVTLAGGAAAREKRVQIAGDPASLRAALTRLVDTDAKTES